MWQSGLELGVLGKGNDFRSSFQASHIHLFKGTLNVEPSAPDKAVLREYVHAPLQFHWFGTA